jgi:hypothetical protein
LQIFESGAGRINKHSQRWVSIDSLDTIPIPSPHRRAIFDLAVER